VLTLRGCQPLAKRSGMAVTPPLSQIQYKTHHFFQKTIAFQTSLKNWTMNKALDVDSDALAYAS